MSATLEIESPVLKWPAGSQLSHLITAYNLPVIDASGPRPPQRPLFLDSSELKIFIPLTIYEWIRAIVPPYHSGALFERAAERIADLALSAMLGQPTFQDGLSHAIFALQHTCSGLAHNRMLDFTYRGQIICPKQPPYREHELNLTVNLRDETVDWDEEGKEDKIRKLQSKFSEGKSGAWNQGIPNTVDAQKPTDAHPFEWYGGSLHSVKEIRDRCERGMEEIPNA